jgi:hypothetical protein
LTSKRRHRTDRKIRNAQQSINEARDAVQQVASAPDLPFDVDPASALFFEYAAPLLMTARTEQEFATASSLAEFVWTATHFNAASQVALLADFIEDTQVPEQMIPWLLDVYAELAARKMALVGE